MLKVLLVAVALAAAAWGWVRFWAWKLRLVPRPDQTLWAETDDGWRLPLRRYRSTGSAPHGTPVLLCHGLGANGRNMDLPGPHGLAQWLAARGYDCFVLDLRGNGGSRPPRARGWRRFNFDDYVRRDAPAALEAVRRATGREEVAWVGHSMGGIIGYALASTPAGERLSAFVAIASPILFPRIPGLGAIGAIVRALPARWPLRSVATFFAPFAGKHFPPGPPLRALRENIEPAVHKRLGATVPDDAYRHVLLEFIRWTEQGSFDAEDGADYREAMRRSRVPALFVAGGADQIAPPRTVEAAHALWGGEKRYRSFPGYGHVDLVFGRTAPDEVFPEIAAFLDAHARARPAPDPDRALSAAVV